MTEVGPTLEGRFKTLQGNVAKQLGLQPPPAAAKPAVEVAFHIDDLIPPVQFRPRPRHPARTRSAPGGRGNAGLAWQRHERHGDEPPREGVHLISEAAERDVRELLAVPANFRILFMQGGGLGENAIVPMNLSRGGKVDVVVTGSWSRKSAAEARRYADVNVAAEWHRPHRSPVPTGRCATTPPIMHLCTNETIDGVEFHDLPHLGNGVPLVIDFSSHLLSRPIDWGRVGLAFGGAQKNSARLA